MKKVNLTIELSGDKEIFEFEGWLRQYVNVIDFRILPDTDKLYDNDTNFRKLVKAVKEAQRERDVYINERN